MIIITKKTELILLLLRARVAPIQVEVVVKIRWLGLQVWLTNHIWAEV